MTRAGEGPGDAADDPSGLDGLEPVELELAGLSVAGLRSPARAGPGTGAGAPPRLLCLHGWLDDAASFAPLAAHLPGVELVALDLPGHGLSAHAEAGYTLFDMALAARRAMSALGWERCTVVGHSLGANVAPWLAAAAPEAVARLVLIEGLGPRTEEAEALPGRLVRAFADRLDGARFRPRTFPDLDAAVDHRLRNAPMERASARLIMARQCEAVEGGVRWRFDPALRHASAEYRTEAQALAVLGAVACPTLAVLAEEGYLAGRPETPARLAALADARTVRLPGRHHLHMDDPGPVARAVLDFLDATR